MRKMGLGTALVIILLLTAALTGVQFLGYQLVGLPFTPLDISDWLVRSGVGVWLSLLQMVTGLLTPDGQTTAATSQTAELLLSVALFFVLAIIVGFIFYLFVGRRRTLPDGIDGVTIGAIFGVPSLLVSLYAGRSLANPAIIIVWVLGLFLVWGVALSFSFRRLMRPLPAAQPVAYPEANEATAPEDPEDAVDMDRRAFLFKLGVSTAAITAVGITAGALLGKETPKPLRPFPVADAKFRANQSQLLENFRRFAIVSFPPDRPEDAKVMTLGTEYPDRNYVSVWLGEGSPIVIYENIETALAAYGTNGRDTVVLWLDDPTG